MEQVQFNSQLTFPEYLKASFYMTYRRPIMMVLTMAGVFSLVLFIMDVGHADWHHNRYPFVYLLAAVYLLGFIPALIYFKCRKNFKAKNRLTEDMEWRIDKEWIAVTGESFETKMTWDKIYRVVETKAVFLIYHSKFMAHVVSKGNMDSGTVRAFRDLLNTMPGVGKKLRAD